MAITSHSVTGHEMLGGKSSLQKYAPYVIVPGGGGYLTKFNTGRLRLKVQPLTLLYTILADKVPLLLPFIEKRYPFHIPTSGSLVLIFM